MTYSWMNEDGEPIMDGAAYRYEAYLDSTYEPDPDDFYDYDEPEPLDPSECDHGDLTYKSNGSIECDGCESIVGKWEHRDAEGWPIPTFFDQSNHPDAPEDAHLDGYWEDRLTTLYE